LRSKCRRFPRRPRRRICAAAVSRITLCIYIVRYEWDEGKSRRNQQKHGGISFELATLAFEDEHCLVYTDHIDQTGEQRWIALGMAQPAADTGIFLVVAHVYREDEYGEEVIRIVSARQAEKREIRRYQAQAALDQE
jgi:uncharacterized DUF497 family protein